MLSRRIGLMRQMGSIPNTIYYCCVVKEAKVIAQYTRGDPAIEKLASLCLERAPPLHACYFQTVQDQIFAFLMEDDHVFFAIADAGLGKSSVKEFLEHVRYQFKKVSNNGTKGSLRLASRLREDLVPVLRRLIDAFERGPSTDYDRLKGDLSSHGTADHLKPQEPFFNNQVDFKKNCRLGKSFKYEKFSVELPEVREDDVPEVQTTRAAAEGHRIDIPPSGSRKGTGLSSSLSMRKSSSSKFRSEQLSKRMWCRLVKVVIIVDILLCLILVGIWLGICKGFKCLS